MLFTIQYLHKLTIDARNIQILCLGTFLGFGLFALDWTLNLSAYISVIFTALLTQFVFILLKKLPIHSLKSALITALGLCLLLKATDWYWYALAAFLAISSKFILRFKGKHIFNPANFGIIASILLTHQTWISPGQWGSNSTLILLFGAAGLIILAKVSRLETGVTFLLVFGALLYLRQVVYLGWGADTVIHKMSNGSFLLFAFFMITDPMTIPNHKKARIIWAIFIAVTSFILTQYSYIHTAGMWVLFFASPFTLLFDKILPSTKFQWRIFHKSNKKQSL